MPTTKTSPMVRFIQGAIKFYRWCLSPLLGTRCRFAPTCSEYAHQALERHGAVRGTALAIKRIARCHPWGGEGFDPVPEKRDEH